MDDKIVTDATQTCGRCGASFRCGALAGDATCWCATLPALPPDRVQPGARCLCAACLADEIARARQTNQQNACRAAS